MGNRKRSYLLLVVIMIIFPLLNSISVVAQDKEAYVGIDEGDEFEWSVSYDEDGIEEFYEDMGINVTYLDVDEDLEAVKIVILEIDEEDEHSGNDGVEITYNFYESEDRSAEDWDLEDEGEEGIIFDFNHDDDIVSFYQYCAYWGVYLVANDVDWEYVMSEMDEDLDDDGSASASGNSIYIHIYEDYIYLGNNTYKIEDIYVDCEYNNDGVLQSYNFRYYDDTLIEATLEWSIMNEYWVFLIIGLVALVSIIIIIVIVYNVTKKPKAEKVFKKEEVKPEEIYAKPEEIEKKKPSEMMFCPYCGNPTPTAAKFCELCGKSLYE